METNYNLMKAITRLLILTVLLFISACSTQSSKDTSSLTIDSEITKDQELLCVYRKVKGIAELIAVHTEYYQFNFYPGDNVFEVNKKLVKFSGELIIGQELKALKKVMNNKIPRKDCPALEFDLIN